MAFWTLLGGLIPLLSIGLLSVLLYVWLRNYRQYRTGLTLGFLSFGIALFLENVTVLYMWYMMEMMYATATAMQRVFLLASALEFLALAIITWVTLR